MDRASYDVAVIGAGLAGSEATRYLASRGLRVMLVEMRPDHQTPAHETGGFAELVCSNSLGGDRPSSPAGILKQELRAMDSIVMRAAEAARVPAGGALAVDRNIFSSYITDELESDPRVDVVRTEARDLYDVPTIIAAGPLCRGALADRITEAIGSGMLSFFDAAAPIVAAESIDMSSAYRAGRWGQADDYINCPLERDEYYAFVDAMIAADRAPLHEADMDDGRMAHFEGCLPVEVMAERGRDTLRFGPMRPVGLPDPRTGREPFAVIQLRRDDRAGMMYGLVGCQTNLKWGEQDRVFRMVPALRGADFVRRGVMHRNTFVCAPAALDPYLRPMRDGAVYRSDLFLAGQITGVEGYVESAACGLAAAMNCAALIEGREMPQWPEATAIGSLLRYLRTAEPKGFQPMNVNLGIFPPLDIPPKERKKMTKPQRCEAYGARSAEAMASFAAQWRAAREEAPA